MRGVSQILDAVVCKYVINYGICVLCDGFDNVDRLLADQCLGAFICIWANWPKQLHDKHVCEGLVMAQGIFLYCAGYG